MAIERTQRGEVLVFAYSTGSVDVTLHTGHSTQRTIHGLTMTEDEALALAEALKRHVRAARKGRSLSWGCAFKREDE